MLKKPHWLFLSLLFFHAPLNADDKALLIGISEYQDPDLYLPGPDQDIEDMQNFVRDYWGFKNVNTLTNKKATHASILNALEQLQHNTQGDDRIFIYYSGHGHYTEDTSADEKDGVDEALVAYDTERVKGETHPAKMFKNLVSDDEIKQRLDKLKSQRVFILVDSCHSGTMHRSIDTRNKSQHAVRSPQLATLTRSVESLKQTQSHNSLVDKRDNMIFFSAVAANQLAMTDGSQKPARGVFTNAFIRGIQDKQADLNHDQNISYSELFEHLRRESKAFYGRNQGICPTPRAIQSILIKGGGISLSLFNRHTKSSSFI